jgi:acyl-CoA synthetase (AMP-forming)/AMP-acid ligase II
LERPASGARPAASSIPRSYAQLLTAAEELARGLQQHSCRGPAGGGHGPRIGLVAAPGPEYVAGTWAIWRAGGIAVPLATSHPPKELQHVLEDAAVSQVPAVGCSCTCRPQPPRAAGPRARAPGTPGAAQLVSHALLCGAAAAAARLLRAGRAARLAPAASGRAPALPPPQVLAPSSHVDLIKDLAAAQGAKLHVLQQLGHELPPDSLYRRPASSSSSSRAARDGEVAPAFSSSAGSSGELGAGSLIMYTSGTTGKPKGVLHTHG